MAEFTDRVAIVTGSSSGIGETIAKTLGALGAHVVVNSATSVEAGKRVASEIGSNATYIQADIADKQAGQRLIDETVSRYGRLDILINNAGWTTLVDHRNLDALTDDIFDKTFDVNVTGTWMLTKYALEHLKKSDAGNVVTITSIAGVRPDGSSIAYAMTKATLNHMTVLLAKSCGPVRVNAVAPGLVQTPWTKDWGVMHDFVAKASPLGRSAYASDCSEAVLGIVRNPHMTGQVIVVDGGFTLVS
ncbi:MAG: SDR family NAD(P)-dependent oxidoreductase [Ilumatobacteraceae bacterium]